MKSTSEHDMPTRREADNILYGVVETIGEIKGELKEFNKNQREQNEKLDDILQNTNIRVDVLEKRFDRVENRAVGIAIGAGAGGAGILAGILKFLGLIH